MNCKPNEYRRGVWLCVSICGILLWWGGLHAHAQIRIAPDKEAAKILNVVENKPDPKIAIEPLTGQPGTSTLVRNPQRLTGPMSFAFRLRSRGAAATRGYSLPMTGRKRHIWSPAKPMASRAAGR
jgi:hypothetical protein